jgi:hypothetical protein
MRRSIIGFDFNRVPPEKPSVPIDKPKRKKKKRNRNVDLVSPIICPTIAFEPPPSISLKKKQRNIRMISLEVENKNELPEFGDGIKEDTNDSQINILSLMMDKKGSNLAPAFQMEDKRHVPYYGKVGEDIMGTMHPDDHIIICKEWGSDVQSDEEEECYDETSQRPRSPGWEMDSMLFTPVEITCKKPQTKHLSEIIETVATNPQNKKMLMKSVNHLIVKQRENYRKHKNIKAIEDQSINEFDQWNKNEWEKIKNKKY